jgi:hypothetical protein
MTPDGPEARDEVTGLDPWGLRRIEQLLTGLEGVDSIKLVPDGIGGIEEIHVLSSSTLGAKQIVRNIESALMAEFSVEIDHRKISVAQVQMPDIPRAEVPEPVPAAPAAASAAKAGRDILLETFDVERRGGQAVCRVELRRGESVHVGEAEGADYATVRLEVAANAVLRALENAHASTVRFVISDVSSTQVAGQPLVIALVRAFAGRRSTTLPGASRVHDSLEEAAILACLDATNRWVGASR